jgi:hypothetical protein
MQVIDDQKKIENIFKLLIKTNSIFTLRNLLTEYKGKISDIEYDNVMFNADVEINDIQPSLRVSFYYLNKYHYFDANVVSSEKKVITLEVPAEIYTRAKRQYKRYPINDPEVTCHLKLINFNQNIQQGFETQGLSQNLRQIYQEINKEKPDFPTIVQLINEENRNICDEFKIFSGVDSLPDQNVAAFLKYYRRPLLLNNLQEIQYSKHDAMDKDQGKKFYQIRDYIGFLHKTHSKEVKSIIHDLIAYYKENSIYALLYVPVVILSNVIMVLRIVNRVDTRKIFNESNVNYFISIAKVINEAFIKNKLNAVDERSQHIQIDDVSLAGVGIDIQDKLFVGFLKQDTKVRVYLDHNKRPWISFVGLIKRKIKKEDATEIGIEMSEILPDNHAKLINYVNKISSGEKD